jgi:oligopeptide transport system permease protein
MSGSILEQLVKFFFSVIPFPKLICTTDFSYVSIDGVDTFKGTFQDCRTVIFDLGRIYKLDNVAEGTLVTDYLFSRMGVSFRVGIFAVIIELVLGYPFGVLMAKYQNGLFDKIGKGYIMIVDAIPGVAYYYILMAIFCNLIQLPYKYEASNPLSYLPAILTMGIAGASGIGLWVRRYMVDEFNSDYVKFARSKGLKENRIMTIHVLRNAVVPLVRTIPSAVIGALMGSYFIENIYGIPGIGNALMAAQNSHNSWMIQGIILFSAFLSVASYLIGDIATAAVDPRISFTE